MKKIIALIIIAVFTSMAGFAQNTWPMAAASPKQTLTQQFGTSFIELSYSRPGVKGRVIFGDVVPFDKIWRTGANAATTIKFGEEVMINGAKVPAGKYGILTIPGKTEWILIITKDTTVNNAASYKIENDLLRLKIKPAALPFSIETMTFDINNIKPNEARVILLWDKVEVSFKVTVDLDTKMMKSIQDMMANADTIKPYYQAATYYYDNGKDLNQALVWVNKALETNPDAFYILHTKAKIQYKLKDKKSALATAQLSLDKAKAANNDDFVKSNEKLIAEINASK
jgi:hypothetical protein